MIPAFRLASAADAAGIAALARESFSETFGHLYRPEDLAAFLAGHTEAAYRDELCDPAIAIRLAEMDGKAVGFAKIGPISLPVQPDRPALELRQFYFLKACHGTGMAAEMMNWVLAEVAAREAERLFLSVFIDNHRARKFYARYGFEPVGRYDFRVGNHVDEDIIMRLELTS